MYIDFDVVYRHLTGSNEHLKNETCTIETSIVNLVKTVETVNMYLES